MDHGRWKVMDVEAVCQSSGAPPTTSGPMHDGARYLLEKMGAETILVIRE
jgi:hypothetical protein